MKTIHSMHDLCVMAAQNYYDHFSQSEIQISSSQKNDISKFMYVLLQQLKTNLYSSVNLNADQLQADYQIHPFIYGMHGYYWTGNWPEYISLVPAQKIDPENCRQLIKFVQADHDLTLLPTAITKTIDHHFFQNTVQTLRTGHNHFQKVIPWDQIEPLSSQQFQQIEDHAYQIKLNNANWTQQLYAHVQAVLNQNHLQIDNNRCLDLSLMTAAYIVQHHHDFDHDEYDHDKISTNDSYQWINRWFILKQSYSFTVNFTNHIVIACTSIEKLNKHYPNVSGQYSDRFAAYDNIIELYAMLDPTDIQNLINTWYDYFDYRQHDDGIALDWNDLGCLDLPDLDALI